MKVPYPGILVAALALIIIAIIWYFLHGTPLWLAGMIAGGGTITLGVWLGAVMTRDPGLIMSRRKKPPTE
jgi:hypothetical protein